MRTTRTKSSKPAAVAAALLSIPSVLSAQGEPPPTAEEILRLVRYSQAAKEQDFTGQIIDSSPWYMLSQEGIKPILKAFASLHVDTFPLVCQNDL